MKSYRLLTTLFFPDETVTAVIDNAVDANQFHASVAEMFH